MDLSGKISYLLRTNGLSQQDLANKIGISKQLINSLCSGKIKNSKSIYKIARFFKVEYEWFFQADEKPIKNEAKLNQDILILDYFHKIPLITTTLINKDSLQKGKIDLTGLCSDFELTSDPDFENLFCLPSTNNSLKFTFGDHTTLIFHTKLIPRDGDFVIAYLPDKDLFVYRFLKIHGPEQILIPTDEDIYKPLRLRENDLIVAVLYEKRVKRKS